MRIPMRSGHPMGCTDPILQEAPMKVRRLDKMTLHRETLRTLESRDIRRAAGGGILTAQASCFCTKQFTNCNLC
jgi:hypothetical protein